MSKKDRRQPVVKLSVVGDTPPNGITSRTVKVKIDVTDAPADKDNPKGSGARDVRLFRNGSLVKVWHGGAQCGICTPGMILAAVDLLSRNPTPTESDIRNGLAGNLCRCTGYMKIFESVVRACQT